MLSSAFVAELLVSLIQQAWIFQTDRIPSTHWDLDIYRLSSAFVAELLVSLCPRYEIYRGYIVFAFSVIMFVCLSVCWFVCLSVYFFLSKISKQLLDLGF